MKTLIKHITIVSMLLAVAFQANARKSILSDPASIHIENNLNTELVNKAIAGAMIQKGWIKESINDDGSIDATYVIRSHKISMNINHSNNQVDFKYISSINMKYKAKKKKQYIHRNYMSWTSELANQIKANISMGESYDYDKEVANATRTSNPAPLEVFKNFSQFRLEPTTLASPYQGQKGNEVTRTNLDHNLKLGLNVRLDSLNALNKGGRTLIIKPNIEAVKFIGTGARIWIGAMAGKSWILLKVEFIDEATGKTIADPELYRVAGFSGGFSVSREDYKMVEDMALDIARYFEDNFEKAIGGGVLPPREIRQKIVRP